MGIKFPIEVKEIKFENSGNPIEKPMFGNKAGQLVKVRPCGEKYNDKTFVGFLIGEVPLGQSAKWNAEEGILTIRQSFHNPAIFVPELGEVIYGCSSWWGTIDSEEELKAITDDDIDNVWYVRALKALNKEDVV